MQTELTTRELLTDPTLQSFLPPLQQEFYEGLEAGILEHGCLAPLVVWGDTIVDGHLRYEICKRHGLPFDVRQIEFESVEDALSWMLQNQVGQRNLERGVQNEAMKSPDYDEVQTAVLKIDPNLIRTDLGTQVRVALNREAVEDYASGMRRGDQFPPIDVFYDRENDLYILVDGFHRYFAHVKAKPGEPILAKRRYGNLETARWAAIAANKRNSVRRTNEDKRRATEWALVHACGVRLSNRQIAEHVGVDEITVRRARARLESTATLSQSPERVGRDGRTINTRQIGKRLRNDSSRELAAKTSLKNLLGRIDSDNAEDFLLEAIDICSEKLDTKTVEKLLRRLKKDATGE